VFTRPVHARRPLTALLAVAGALAGSACTTATDPLPAASVRIIPADPVRIVRLNQAISLSAQCLNARGEVIPGHAVTWFTSNPLVASVDNDGDVVGLLVGQSTVSANCGAVAAQVQIQVTLVPASSVSITPNGLSLFVGDVQQLAATVQDSANNPLTLQDRQVIWSSDNLPVASVSTGGVVQGVTQGTANVRVTVDGVVSPAIVVTVQRVPVASVTILPLNPPSVMVGQQLQLIAVLRDENGNELGNQTVTWSSLDGTKATVGATTGVVTGIAPGSVTIQATSEGVTGASVLTIIP